MALPFVHTCPIGCCTNHFRDCISIRVAAATKNRSSKSKYGASALGWPLFGGYTAAAEPEAQKTDAILKLPRCWDQNTSDTELRNFSSLQIVRRRPCPQGQLNYKVVSVSVQQLLSKVLEKCVIFGHFLCVFHNFCAFLCDTDCTNGPYCSREQFSIPVTQSI